MGSLSSTHDPTHTCSSPVNISNVDEWGDILHAAHRPLLIHLNADTTWLIQLPYPRSVRSPPGRTHYNILLDPWLQGPQSDVAWWFSSQWHVVPPSVATISDLNDALRHVEGRRANGPAAGGSLVDVVAISHEFTDHCHRATLEELPPSTPVYAADLAANLIRSWNHFDKVLTLPVLGEGVDWRKLTVGPIPDWVALGRITTPGNALYYHAAILVAFDIQVKSSQAQGTGEAVVYSPHGINAEDLAPLRASNLKTLALMHGMHDVRIWMTKQLNLGALNGIRAVGISEAKYWIATHDEVKTGRGLISPFLLRTSYTFKEAMQKERTQLAQVRKAPTYDFHQLGSGDAVLLE